MCSSDLVFLMDEPLSNLDAKLRVQMRIEIAKLHERLGATIIYVTHDQTEAMILGTRIVVMKDGIVQQVDTPKNLYNNPANLFVAGFIGSPQMNFMDALVNKIDDSNAELKVGNYTLSRLGFVSRAAASRRSFATSRRCCGLIASSSPDKTAQL